MKYFRFKSEKMIWNGNELIFQNNKNIGVAGIAIDAPEELGKEIAKRWNMVLDKKKKAEDI